MKHPLLALPALLLPVVARAHEGHGSVGSHLHPDEAMALVALAAVAVVVIARHWKK